MGLTLEVIKIIALLCDIDSQYTLYTKEAQLQCQQYYVSCIYDSRLERTEALTKCIKERKLIKVK